MRTHHRHVLTALALASGTLALTTNPPASAAGTFEVDTLSDNAADGNTLREAVAAANAALGPDTIVFENGLAGTITLTGGELDVTDDLTITGPGADVITIDGDASSSVITSFTLNVDLAVSGLHLTNGSTPLFGGAIYTSNAGDFELDGVRISNNEATNGGGVYLLNPNGTIVIERSEFNGNTATTGSGGGLNVFDPGAPGAVNINNSSFDGNVAPNGAGGAIDVGTPQRFVSIFNSTLTENEATTDDGGAARLNAERVAITNSTFERNVAGGTGGAVVANASGDVAIINRSHFLDNDATVAGAASVTSDAGIEMKDTTVADNAATIGYGGLLLSGPSVTVAESLIENNDGGTNVGGLLVVSADTFDLDTSTVRGNTADASAGLGMSSIGLARILTSTISDNVATGDGGGIFASGIGPDELRIARSTISGNTAGRGAGIFSSGVDVNVVASTIVENTATSEGGGVFMDFAADDFAMSTSVLVNEAPAAPDTNENFTLNWSILGSGMGLILTGGDFEVGIDPDLGPLGDNGGPTETHLPDVGSPAIDGGDPNGFNDALTDQRGFPRPVGIVDIGAVEASGDAGSIWVPVSPARVVETRPGMSTIDGAGQKGVALTAGEQLTVDAAGRAGVPADAIGAVVNITAVKPEGTGFLTAHACLGTVPTTASLNYTGNVNLGNETIVQLDANGDFCVFSSAATHLTVDVVGFVPAASTYVPLAPVRFVDTRPGGVTFDGDDQAEGQPGAAKTISLKGKNRGGIPVDADAAVLYVAAVGPTSTGFVTVFTCDDLTPLASSLNHVAGANRGNELIVDLGNDGDICIFTSADVHITVDVMGYIPGISNFEALDAPSRILDTRAAGKTVDGTFQAVGKRSAGQTLTLDVAGRAGLPAVPETVTINVTAVQPELTGFVTVFPCGGDVPNAASLNFVPGVNGGNEIIASPNDLGQICLFTSAATHLTADITGSTSR